MITLRDYQQDVIAGARKEMLKHKRVLIQAPTGAGKTVLASFMAQNIVDKGGRAFFICHRRELIDQTSMTFERAGIQHGIVAAGYPMNARRKILVCSIDTLKNRLDKVPEPTVLMWDEAHHIAAAGWAAVAERYRRHWHIGLSATPQRLDGKGLNNAFDAIVNGPSVAWLIENGYLAQYKLFSIPGVDMTGVRTRMGDFAKGGSEAAMDKPSIMGDIVGHWKRHARDVRTIAFAVSVKHSEHLAAAFRSEGVMAVHLDGNTPKSDRKAALRAFADGSIRVVTNVALFGEGYDLAANSGRDDVTVGCVIDANPTQSLGAYLQRCGRALRPQKNHAILLDHAGNAMRHGLPCEDRTWTLNGVEKEERESGVGDNIRQCDACYFVHRPAPSCPACGHVYKIKHREVPQVAGDLQEVDPAELRRQRSREQFTADSYEALVKLGAQRGYKNPAGWARHVYQARRAKLEAKNLRLVERMVANGKI